MPAADTLHGTLVAKADAGVLLCGPSGAGKSDLALRLMGRDWQLVADDRVLLSRLDSAIIGAAPASLAGLLEVRGVGIVTVPYLPSARVRLLVDLVPLSAVARLPDATTRDLLGVTIHTFRLWPLEASAVEKLELLVRSVLSGRFDRM